MKVLVTGGAGFLGSHLVDALVATGIDVVVLDNFHRGSRQNLAGHLASPSLHLIEGDIRQIETVKKAADGAEVVYHLAAQSNVMGAEQDFDYSFSTNVVGTYTVLKAAAEMGARRVVFSSSREVYGEPAEIPVSEAAPLNAKNSYGASKVAGEAYCRAWSNNTGLQVQVLRFGNIYGPGDKDRVIPIWLEKALHGEDLELFGGDQILDFVWVGTAVQALISAAECIPSAPVNVGTGSGTPIHVLARRILEVTQSASGLRILPARQAEVTRFVADVSRMVDALNVTPDSEPLGRLERCVVG